MHNTHTRTRTPETHTHTHTPAHHVGVCQLTVPVSTALPPLLSPRGTLPPPRRTSTRLTSLGFDSIRIAATASGYAY